VTKLLTLEQIQDELKSKNEILMEFEFGENYFNNLVRELPNYIVYEIKPLRKIWIKSGIHSEILNLYLDHLFNQIIDYNKLKTNQFRDFLNSLNINSIEDKFYKLREKLQITDAWPKGKFESWNYRAHGLDIEFDNNENGGHFNIAMTNINSIQYWSVHKYITSINDQSEESKFIVENKEIIPKMFDLLVLQNKLNPIRTNIGQKLYILVD
jgi:hypothetical protein